MPISRITKSVDTPRMLTTGDARRESAVIGPATRPATRSGLFSANCLGTSSPRTRAKNVSRSTTTRPAIAWLYGASAGIARKRLRQLCRQGRPAENAHQDADQGDADLDSRQKAIGGFGQLQRRLRTFVSFVGSLLQPGLPRGNDGCLRHGEQAVQDDQHKDDGEFDEDRGHERGFLGCTSRTRPAWTA